MTRRCTVECLSCGHTRPLEQSRTVPASAACPRCDYVGWAPSSRLDEAERRVLREIPVALRTVPDPLIRLAWR